MDIMPSNFDLETAGRELNIPILARRARLEKLAMDIRAGHAYCVQVCSEDTSGEAFAGWRDHPEFVVGACLIAARSHMHPRRYRSWIKQTGLRDSEASRYIRSFLETVGYAYLESTAQAKRRTTKARA